MGRIMLSGDDWRGEMRHLIAFVCPAGTMKSARQSAYRLVDAIHFDGVQFRTDIGWRALKPHETV